MKHDAHKTVEPVLSFVANLASKSIGEESRLIIGEALRACSAYLNLMRPPEYVNKDAAVEIRELANTAENDQYSFVIEAMKETVHDPGQTRDCVWMLMQSVLLEEEASVVVEVFENEGIPCVALSVDGPGSFPREFYVNGMLCVAFDDIAARWTSATRGGRIDPSPNGYLMRLAGQRMPEESDDSCEPLRAAVEQSLILLDNRDWGALRSAIDAALSIIDGDSKPNPADVNALIREILNESEEDLTKRSIALERMLASDAPPLMIYRERFRRFLNALVDCARRSLPNGGVILVMQDYSSENEIVELSVELSGKECLAADERLVASMSRAIENAHGGSLIVKNVFGAVTITARIPDKIGLTLKEMIPGFGAFSGKSIQILRLIAAGGEGLPTDVFLSGVLEDEIERWLIPRFAESAAVNIAHDLIQDAKNFRGEHARLEKALTQIARRKVKREILKPPHCAQLLRAFNSSERGRAAISPQKTVEQEISKLCEALEKSSPDFMESLRMLARILAKL